MTHKEFILTANQDIKEFNGITSAVNIKKGSTIKVKEDVFLKLQNNETIEVYTREGVLKYDKYMFENEVCCTTVLVEYSVRKLGHRKNKIK
jgi:hypothetical protein